MDSIKKPDPNVILYLVPLPLQGKSRSRTNEHPNNPTQPLAVKFSDAKTSYGVVCGTAPSADIIIRDRYRQRLSKHHLAFTFDVNNRPIARDLGSKAGTKVTYDDETRDHRSAFDWPLLGPSITKGKFPLLELGGSVRFEVIVQHHDLTSEDYIKRVERFRLGTAEPNELLDALNIQSAQQTELQSGLKSPTRDTDPIIFTKMLGEGGFGTVQYCANLTTGDEYVIKQPSGKSIKDGMYNQQDWKNEASIMKRLQHPRIVTLRHADFSSYPILEIEYVPGGNLADHYPFSVMESAQVLCQLSSALKYIHSCNIAHRDIKPENILVVNREQGINVKFADFGLSKESGILRTTCGTPRWIAPEIEAKWGDPIEQETEYTSSVDIWSLGQLVAWMLCGPNRRQSPNNKRMKWTEWLRAHIAEHVSDQNSTLLRLIIDHMMVKSPEERWTADQCYDGASQLWEQLAGTLEPSQHKDLSIEQHPCTGATAIPESQSTLGTPIQSTNHESLSQGLATEESPVEESTSDGPPSEESHSYALPKVYAITSSLVAQLGERNSSKIDSIVNSTEDEATYASDTTIKPIGGQRMSEMAATARDNRTAIYDDDNSNVLDENVIRLLLGNQVNETELVNAETSDVPKHDEQRLTQTKRPPEDDYSLGPIILYQGADGCNEGRRESKRSRKD
ncbi:kinase-like domain-containing protein [Nemania sp. FL0031]|nr:kinase-like domain-containing protein [Nemania sp. FL0031]